MTSEPSTRAAVFERDVTGPQLKAELDVASRRQLLFSARMRFSSETQCIRRQAIDRIIEQNLALSDAEAGLSVREMQDQRIVALPDGTSILPREEIQAGLARLVSAGRIVVDADEPPKYKVADRVRSEIWSEQTICEERFAAIVGRLFRGAEKGAATYKKPFMECLCFIFSRLGEAYVRQLKHEITADELLNQPHVARAFKAIKASHPFIDERHFQSAVATFFADHDPAFAALKWNLAQNYFVAKCLGLDPGGRLLSKEVFGDADIYLDTNILIEALEPGRRHHVSFQVLAKACTDLNIRLNACQISVDELRKVVSYEREAMEKVMDRIPEDTAPKVKGVLFPIYYRQKRAGGNPNLDDIFEYFSEPSTMLTTFYDVKIVDDKWFIDSADAVETSELATEIKRAYGNRPGRRKSKNAADHDALLLRWVRREREDGKVNAWIVTLDQSLPNFLSPSKQGQVPLAIRLDALIQWLSPIALQADEGHDRAAIIFSEALKYNLLPQESFFELGDFLAFAEWEWDTKALPAEDIEGCIRCVRTAAPHLNPADPADREQISREFNKFLRDPGRKYKGELARLEASNEQLLKGRLEGEAQLSKTKSDLEGLLSKKDAELVAARLDIQTRDLRSSAFRRLGLIALVWVLAETAVAYAAIRFGDGQNNFQKIKNAWEFLALPPTCSIVLSWFILGRDRIGALGWSFGRFLAGAED